MMRNSCHRFHIIIYYGIYIILYSPRSTLITQLSLYLKNVVIVNVTEHQVLRCAVVMQLAGTG